MALEMKANCQTCNTLTPPQGTAFICTYECTFCASCSDTHGICPNCSGELVRRPRPQTLAQEEATS